MVIAIIFTPAYTIVNNLFSSGINIVISNNCAVIMNTSGLKSILPAVGMNFLRNRNIGFVKLFNSGAMGVYGFTQLKIACINMAYMNIVMLILITPINATAAIANQI